MVGVDLRDDGNMALLLSCPQGHRWENLSSLPASSVSEPCPTCGMINSAAESLAEMGDTVSSGDELPPPPRPVARQEAKPATFAGYELLGELGRGGMGVVYRARQVSLDRLVALKVMASGMHAGPEELARFRTEVEAVARLQHPNIVQIHEVGEEAGCPYFAMEYVAGGALDRRLRGTPLRPDQAAALTSTLARAIHFVHQHGIVHRDLKPANVLLQMADLGLQIDQTAATSPQPNHPAAGSDQSGSCDLQSAIPKVTDFGLAKRLNQDSPATRTGAVLGTPSYMAPEQAQGKVHDIGPTTDVYALGAILYELLTGRPPFRAANLMETVRQLLYDEPVPPTRLQPRLPRDLETICLRCLQKDPRRRYATALELADDLERFGRGEPVRARPIGKAERLWKWCRRRPAIAALIAVSGLALAALLAIGIATDLQVRHERDLADAQRHTAKRHLDRSLRAVRQIIDVAEERLVNVPRMEQQRRALFAEAIQLYDDLLKEDPGNVEVRRDAARAYRLTGDVLLLLGEPEQAEFHLQHGFDLARNLVAEHPDEAEYRSELARIHSSMGWLYKETGRHEQSEQAYRQAIALGEALPAKAQYRWRLAGAHYGLSILFLAIQRLPEGEKHQRQALAIWQTLANEFPDNPDHWNDLGAGQLTLASILRGQGRLKEAEAEYRAALVSKDKVKNPDAVSQLGYRTELARIQSNLGGLLVQTGRPVDAEPIVTSAVAGFQKLAEDFPAVPVIRIDLAATHSQLAALHRQLNRNDQAVESYRQARSVLQKLADDFAREDRFQKDLAAAHQSLGELLARSGQLAEADAAFQQSSALWTKLADRRPTAPDFRASLASAEESRGRTLAELGQLDDAGQSFQRSLSIREKLAEEFPAVAYYRTVLANSHDALGSLANRRNRRGEAEQAHRRALAIREKLADEFPDDPGVQQNLAHGRHSLGYALLNSGQLEAAEKAYRQALAGFQALTEKHPDDPLHRSNLAVVCNSLANQLRDLRRYAEADPLVQRSLGERSRLVRDFPQVPEYRQHLGHAEYGQGILATDSGQATRAEAPLRRAIALFNHLHKDFPNQPAYQSDLAAAYNGLGNALRDCRRYADAESAWKQCIGQGVPLCKAFPDEPNYTYELAMYRHNLALLLNENLNRLDDAVQVCDQARTALEELVRQHPDTPVYRHILGRTRATLAQVAFQRQQWPQARQHLTAAIAEQRAALKPYPKHPQYLARLADHQRLLAEVLIQMKDHAAAVRLAEELAGESKNGEAPLLRARLLARCIPLVERDPQFDASQRELRVQQLTERALEQLREARAHGWKDRNELKSPHFDALRKQPGFERLLEDH